MKTSFLLLLRIVAFTCATFHNKQAFAKKTVFTNADCHDTNYPAITSCAYYIFVNEQYYCDVWETTWHFAEYFMNNISSNASNIYGVRAFGDPTEGWCDVDGDGTKESAEELIDSWIDRCGSDGDAGYTDPFVNLLNITTVFSNVAIFIQGRTDTITDLNDAMRLAQQLANTNATIYVWDTSAKGDQTELFSTLTGNKSGHVITSNNNLQDLIQVANQQMFPEFLSRGCGGSCAPATSPITMTTTQKTTFSNTSPSTPMPSFTPPQTNNSCVSLELIFILDRSESVIEDFYDNNVTNFVLDIANQFTFFDEASPSYPAFARFGVIQFADDPEVSIPLGNYSRADFRKQVLSRVNYTDGGVSGLTNALNAATNQFKQNSILANRAIILVLNDVSMVDIKNSLDNMHKLENYVSLPIGVITPGRWGDQQEALSHLQILLDNRTELAFPSLDAAESGIPSLIASTFPCEKPPACSALIFIEEASEAVGADSKLMFLKLAQRIAGSINNWEGNPNQRFGLALYAQEVYQRIQLQTFEDFNKTITDFINIMADANFPNGGKTFLQPIFSNLNTVLTSGLYKNYAVLMMGEMEAVKDVGKASPLAQTLSTLCADIYVIDESSGSLPYSLWNTITNNAPGHVLNGVGANQDMLFANLSVSLIPEFNAMTC